MIYFKKNGEVIEKYQVDFDKKELEKLKNEIIDNCSYITHQEYEDDYFPMFDDRIIKNLTSRATGKDKEYWEETRPIYRFSYDEYKPPRLVGLIDELLNGDMKAIDKIFNYDIPTLTMDDMINSASEVFMKIDPENITERKAQLKYLEKLIEQKELNKGQQSIELYYNRLLGLIKFNLIDSLSISELTRIETFLEIELTNKVIDSSSEEKNSAKSLKKVD